MALCACGCGRETAIANKTDRHARQVKGQPLRFIKGHNLGRPRDFWLRMRRLGPEECWPWRDYRTRHGYGQLTVAGVQTYAHRRAWELHHGSAVSEGLDVLHRCDNPPCCNPSHLFLGTAADNVADMWAKGRGAQPKPTPGETNVNARLTAEHVREIRRRAAEGVSFNRLARELAVWPTTIAAVVHRESWRHVP